MSQHLNAQQINEWLIGERSSEQQQHVGQCAQCAAEIAKLEAPLKMFRQAVQDGGVPQVTWKPVASRASVWSLGLRWTAAGALALALAGVPVYRNHVQQVKLREAELASQDAALMTKVEQEILEPIPQPMQPLTKLVSYNPPTSQEKGTKQ
jgi:hypothetical protein